MKLSIAPGTLLAVLAHPDDESFGMGGTLALYARRGYQVVLLCATRGEAGTVDPEHLVGHSSVADLRETELRCAAQHLGLTAVHFLGYRDSGMQGSPDNRHPDAQVAHPVEEVAARIVAHMRELKPDVVVTFDPVGGYRHPDHIHVHKATTLAFERAADSSFAPDTGSPYQPAALYYHVFPHRFLRIATRVMPFLGIDPRHFGRNRDIDLKALTEFDFPVHVRIDIASVMHAKAEAGACHASQGGIQMRSGLLGLISRLIGESESFMRAYPPVHGSMRVLGDLFSSVGRQTGP
jgi:LmbE family N-acetylglucosaminyl deacetylase